MLVVSPEKKKEHVFLFPFSILSSLETPPNVGWHISYLG